MRYGCISKNKRITAGILLVMLLVLVLFSTFYISSESEHDCVGAKCHVCISIQQCENIMNQISNTMPVQIVVVAMLLLLCVLEFYVIRDFIYNTPISRKERMNN